jgi:hypothetical protein
VESCGVISVFPSSQHSLFLNVERDRNDGPKHNYNFDVSKWQAGVCGRRMLISAERCRGHDCERT